MRTAALALSAALIACGSSPPPVSLSGQWPEKAGDYQDEVERWTRSGALRSSARDGFVKILELSATMHSPQWRQAYVERRARREMMPPAARAELQREQRALAEKWHEVMLLVATHTFRENDLQKNERSVWRVALVDSQGNEVRPAEIQSVRLPREFIEAYYPRLGPQDEIYIARFPREAVDIYGPGARRFSLKVAGARGGVELVWQAED